MARIWVERLAGWTEWTHGQVLGGLRAVAPELAHVQPAPTAPSIAFHAWHVARWADLHVEALPGWLGGGATGTQVWVDQRVAQAWGIATADLGDYGGTGAGLGDTATEALTLPAAEVIAEYAEAVFTRLQILLDGIADDTPLERLVTDLYGDDQPLAEVLVTHLSHVSRHLGMIEALRGVLGEHGTATV